MVTIQNSNKLKILIYSPKFYPSIGGLENLTLMLATEWQRQGHEIKVITAEGGVVERPVVQTYYKPSIYMQVRLILWCDYLFMPNISLKGCLLKIFSPSSILVATHQSWYQRPDGSLIWKDRLKKIIARHFTNISCSNEIARKLGTSSVVIGNCYDSHTFSILKPVSERLEDLVFVGRLVTDKGIDILLNAYNLLVKTGHDLSLTIVGTGPEEAWLSNFIKSNMLGKVKYVGPHKGSDLAKLVNNHKVMVIPSRWAEPFGIVALEGLACGCKVVCSNKGGLPEAASNFGFYFDNGDVTGCAKAILEALNGEYDQAELKRHLDAHTPEKVANEYLKVFQHSGNNR